MLSIALFESYLDNAAALGDAESADRMAQRFYGLILRIGTSRMLNGQRFWHLELLSALNHAGRHRSAAIRARLAGRIREAMIAELDADLALQRALYFVLSRNNPHVKPLPGLFPTDHQF
jgi:hypothetical protein